MVLQRTLPGQTQEPVSLYAHAIKDLRYIRQTMESAASFTAVPGWGLAAIGLTVLVTASVVRLEFGPTWLLLWIAEAGVALLIGNAAMGYKANRAGISLWSGPALRFMMNLYIPILAGIPLTWLFYQQGLYDRMPGLWLLLYGAGVMTGGAFSVGAVRLMGLCFLLTGMATLSAPTAWVNSLMAFGFGGFHIFFGSVIARKHGG